MEITRRLKERFCKDYSLPIKIFDEPYFTDRINLLDPYYGTVHLWNDFLKFVVHNPDYHNEEDYFEEYNHVKDSAINAIKDSAAYQEFNSCDMNSFAVDSRFRTLRTKDIYHAANNCRTFISIDMQKANFNALHHYSSDIFGGASTWIEFIGRYTSNPHILHSKYIRQVILGNCNPKRHITYEKHLMSDLLGKILSEHDYFSMIVFFSNDEIVFDITDVSNPGEIQFILQQVVSDWVVPMKVELFTLNKVDDMGGYYKSIRDDTSKTVIEFKCVDSFSLPFIIRKMKDEPVTDLDRTFVFEGRLARFIE